MPDIKTQSTSPTLVDVYPSTIPDSEIVPQQQSQWSCTPKDLSLHTESPNMFMPNSLDFPNLVPARPLTQPTTKALSSMHADPTLNFGPTWCYQPTLAPDDQDMNYFPDDPLTGILSSSSFAPLPTALSCPSCAYPSSTLPSSGLLNCSNMSVAPKYSGRSSLGANHSSFTYTPSARDQAPSISGHTITTTTTTITSAEPPTLHSELETTSRAEGIQEASKSSSSSSTLILTIHDPNSETINNVMGMLAGSKGNMILQVK